ncbi:ribosome maturation factor RimP [Streptomyces sp. SBT349]|uniref:ribosome maturation factor RimP n=1 Tax=Streptomyces sp. SBT349 TaxID=1580539 RepID=UPI00066C281C|nr:ribosome maturation factor RimP [Streptomyces sp. SBT349]
MSTTQIDRLRELLEPLAGKRGMDLEDVRVTPAGRRRVLQVVVDTDQGVGLDACAELSREVSAVLDESDVMGGAPYVLEVTSPGAERPLTEPRHYRRSVGRLLRLRLREGGELTGRLLAFDDAGLDLEVPGEKGRKATARRVGLDDVASARIELEFSRRPAGDQSPKEA